MKTDVDDKLTRISISMLNEKQKAKLLQKLVLELKKGKAGYLDKVFEIIDTIPHGHMRSSICYKIQSVLTNEVGTLFEKESTLRYRDKKGLINLILSIGPQYDKYKLDAAKRLLSKFNDLEISNLLRISSNREVRNYILDNYSQRVDVETLKKIIIEMDKNDSVLKVFDGLSIEDKIDVIQKDGFESMLYERMGYLKGKERLYFELRVTKSHVTPVPPQVFLEFINANYQGIDTFYYGDLLLHFENEDLKMLLQHISKNSIFYGKIKEELILREYGKLEEKDKSLFLSKLSFEVLDKYFILFSSGLELLDNKQLMQKLKDEEISNEHFGEYVLKRLGESEIKALNIKLPPVVALSLDGIDSSNINLPSGEFERENLVQSLYMRLNRAKGEPKHLQVFKDLLKAGTKLKIGYLNNALEFEDLLEVLDKNNGLIDSLYYYDFDESELLRLKEYAISDHDYLHRVLSIKDYNGNLNDDFSKLQLDLLARYRGPNIPIMQNINVIKDLIKTGNRYSLVNVMTYASGNSQIFDEVLKEQLDEEILKTIDSSRKLLELYKTIDEENLNKAKDKRKISGSAIEYLKRDFFKYISKIDDSKEVLMNLIKDNPFIMLTLNYRLLDLLDGKNLEYFSRYEDLKRLYNFKYNAKVLISKIANRIVETRKYPDDLLEKCLTSIAGLTKENIDGLLNEDIDKVIYLMSNESIVLKGDISSFELKEKEYCHTTILNSNNMDDCLDAYFRDKYKFDLSTAQRLVRVYGKDIEKLKRIYSNDGTMIAYLNDLMEIKRILEVKNKSDLVELYNAKSINKDFTYPLSLEENLKIAYNREIITNLYKPKDEDLIANNIYEVNGEFNLLVSVIGAFIENKDSVQRPSDNWNDKEKLVNHGVCASLISNNNLSFVYDKNKLIYGFNNLEETSLLKVASYDLGSNSNSIEVDAYREEEYRTSKGIIDNVRGGHSELVIERRKENSNEKRQPDYIVAIDNVRDMDLKAAKEFNIPIVLIKSEKIAIQESKKLDILANEVFANPTKEGINNLIREYHNNYAGFLTIDPKLNEKYFNPRKFEVNLMKLIMKINCIEDREKREALLVALLDSINGEEKKRAYISEKYYPFSFDSLKAKIDMVLKKEERIDKNSVLNKLKKIFRK